MKARNGCVAVLTFVIALVLAGCGGQGDSGSDTSAGFDAESYFRGKTVRVIVTHSAGGGSDLYGRFVAGLIGDGIPGNPRVTVTNVEGLGGISDIFNAGESDLVIGVTSQASALYTTVLDPASTIDPSKVQMIGGTGGDPRALTLFTDAASAYADFAKANGAAAPELKWAQTVGGPADVVSDSFFASWLCDTMKSPCAMASVASDDSTDLNLMVQRGELNTQLGTLITMFRDYSKDLAGGSVKIAFEYAQDPNTTVTPPQGVALNDVKNVIPTDSMADYERILPIISGGGLGKHFWAGPALPADVVNTLRDAYSTVVDDPNNVAELQKVMAGEDSEGGGYSYTVSPVSGEDAQKAYQENADIFEENLSYYEELQKKYYDQYWK
jgi:hypothetical protein